MENKEISMYNIKDELETVIFEGKPMANRWRYSELIAEATTLAKGNNFMLTFEIAKRIFPIMLVSHDFKTKTIEGRQFTTQDQIKEFFINDPDKLAEVVYFLMGLMRRN